MTKKERGYVYEAAALSVAGLFGAVVVPTLVSARDSVALLCGLVLLLGWLAWFAYFFYRMISK